MQVTLGFSPCPNDTFIFYALLSGKIDTGGITFVPLLADVETLNLKALNCDLDITKISFAAYLSIQQNYLLLTSGSALGNNCGPLLISKNKIRPEKMVTKTVAIPGIHTTANFLFDTFFPKHGGKKEIVFSAIEDTVLNETTSTGVIIHENRFTYEKRGLFKIADLGEKWEQLTGFPIPLGGIAVKRSLPIAIALKVNALIKESVQYAFSHPEETIEYVRQYAQEMEEAVMWQHIQLYVNEYTINLGSNGKAAIDVFFGNALTRKLQSAIKSPLFVDETNHSKAVK